VIKYIIYKLPWKVVLFRKEASLDPHNSFSWCPFIVSAALLHLQHHLYVRITRFKDALFTNLIFHLP